MEIEFIQKFQETLSRGEPFVVATVVEAKGSTSARTGAKAIFSSDGVRRWGWVGGGCAESAVGEEASQAIREDKAKMITVSLEDEVSGVGMPCGGTMQIYVEPYISKPELLIFGSGPVVQALVKFGHTLGFEVTVHFPNSSKETYPDADHVLSDDIHLDGVKATSRTYVIIATQHKADDLYLKKVAETPTPYIALMASKKRKPIIFDMVLKDGVSSESLKKVRAPAGIRINSVTPEEIALSIIAEIVALRRGVSPTEWPEDDGKPDAEPQRAESLVAPTH